MDTNTYLLSAFPRGHTWSQQTLSSLSKADVFGPDISVRLLGMLVSTLDDLSNVTESFSVVLPESVVLELLRQLTGIAVWVTGYVYLKILTTFYLRTNMKAWLMLLCTYIVYSEFIFFGIDFSCLRSLWIRLIEEHRSSSCSNRSGPVSERRNLHISYYEQPCSFLLAAVEAIFNLSCH